MTATFLNGQVLTADMLNNAFGTKLDAAQGTELNNRIEATETLLAPIEQNGLVDSIIKNTDDKPLRDVIVEQVESIADLVSIAKTNGRTVLVKSYYAGLKNGGGTFVYDSTKSSINDGGMVINGWVRQPTTTVNPIMYGAKGDGVTDDSLALAKTIQFAVNNVKTLDGLGLTYACNDVHFDSNLTFNNANLVCNKFDTDLISVLNSGESNTWLENVELNNIKIDGKRANHINIKAQATSEDGGRHGFRIVRKTRNVKLTNCEAVNCAGDGIMLYPKSGAGNNRIVDVVLTDCNFSGNRRHGGSSDSVNGIKFTRVKCNRNGLDIDANAAQNTGLRGDTFNGNLYGNGWDFEEYDQDIVSTGIVLDDCEMLDNAKSAVLVFTYGNTSESSPKATMQINGGSFNKGRFNDTNNAIIMRPIAGYTGTVTNTALLSVVGANLNSCDISCAYALNFMTRNLVKNGQINVLDYCTAHTDVPKTSVYVAANSNAYTELKNHNGDISYDNGTLTIAPATKTVNQYYDVDASGYVDIAIVSGAKLGGLKLKLGSEGQTETSFTDFNNSEYLTVSNKKIIPLRGGYNLGDATNAFNNIYLSNAPIVSSDRRLKTDIRQPNDAEKLVAKALKSQICIYRLLIKKDDATEKEAQLNIGAIAQDVMAVFKEYGLNANDYKVVHYDEEADRYAIAYEQLILFILVSI